MEPVQYLLYASMGASVASLGFLYLGLKQKKIKETTGNALKEYKEQSTLTSAKNKIEDLINSSLFSSKREDEMEKDGREQNFLRKYGLYGKKKSENIELEEDVNGTVEEVEEEDEYSLFKKHSAYYEDNENFDDNYESEIEKELEEEFINDFYGEEDSYEELEWKFELKNEHFLYVMEEEETDLEREFEEDIKRTAHKIQDEEFEREYSHQSKESYQSKESEEDRELRKLKEEIESEEAEEEEELQIDVAKFLEEKRQKELENGRYEKVYEEEEEKEIEENYEIFERETSSKSLEDEMDEFSEDDVDEDFLRRLNEISKKYD